MDGRDDGPGAVQECRVEGDAVEDSVVKDGGVFDGARCMWHGSGMVNWFRMDECGRKKEG